MGTSWNGSFIGSISPIGEGRWLAAIANAMRPLTWGNDIGEVWERWKATRDELFSRHPQSPLSDFARLSFKGLPYFPYDPAWRIEARLEPILDSTISFRRNRSSGDSLPEGRAAELRAWRTPRFLDRLLDRRLRRQSLLALPGRKRRRFYLRGRALPDRHGEGQRLLLSRGCQGSSRRRFQLRLQPFLRL